MQLTDTVLSVSDIQYPYHDKKVWKAVLKFAKQLKPSGVILNGDGFDFYDLSKFDKNPARLGNLQKEIKAFTQEVLAPLDSATMGAWKSYTEGNHEARVQKYLWHQAPELSGLSRLEVPALLHLDEYGFDYTKAPVKIGKHLIVLHGHLISKHAGWSAKQHYDRYGTSLVIGHTHRIGTYMLRDWNGMHIAVEQGCLCDLEPEYEQHPNWQQGFAVIHVFSDKTFSVQPVTVVNRKYLLYGNERFDV